LVEFKLWTVKTLFYKLLFFIQILAKVLIKDSKLPRAKANKHFKEQAI
jgi:hypothetical protein